MNWTVLNRFRRITTSGSFIPEIDGMRFIAISSVVLFHVYGEFLVKVCGGLRVADISGSVNVPSTLHAWAPPLHFIGHGSYGVQIFFTISGFILAWPFAMQYLRGGKPVGLGPYFLRRVTRLEPPYVLSLLLRALLLYATTQKQTHDLLVHLLASIFYVHNIAFGEASTINAVAWSLEIEIQFYCLVPLLTRIFTVRSTWLRRSIMILAIITASPLQSRLLPGWHDALHPQLLEITILSYYQFFLAGILVADIYVDGWNKIPEGLVWDIMSVPLWVAMFWMSWDNFRFFGPVLLPLLFVAGFKGPAMKRFLGHPVISTIGGMCYSIYLTHRTIIVAGESVLARTRMHGPGGLAISIIVLGAGSVAVGSVYFLVIERPCMDRYWPQKLVAYFRRERQLEAA